MDPRRFRERQRRMQPFYRGTSVVGVLLVAVCVGLFLGGMHSASIVALALGTVLFVVGQRWASRL